MPEATEHEEPTGRPPSVAPPSSGASPASLPVRLPTPIARRAERLEQTDPPALATSLRVKMRTSFARGDSEGEGTAAARLARHLVALDARLDEAVTAGRRAVVLRPEDHDLRRMLANVLQSLGEPGLAAATLRPLVDASCAHASRDKNTSDDSVNGLLMLGDLLLRGGDIEGALESFRYVAVVAPERPEGQERVAMTHYIAPEHVTPEIAARGFIGAAKKHQLANNETRALEALARAFEVDPHSTLASSVLADSLEDLGRLDAADAVRAEHARALGNRIENAAEVHELRREKAQMRGDRASLVATVLDELVDLAIHTEPSSAERVSAHSRIERTLESIPWLASAHRRVRALLESGPSAIEAWRAIGEASSSSLEDRIEAWGEVVARDLDDERALTSLREQARVTRDPTPIVDALVRGLRHAVPTTSVATWAARAAELALWAEEGLDDPMLASWAWNRLLSVAPQDSRARDELTRLHPRVAKAEERLVAARRAMASEDPATRNAGRRETVTLLAGRPDEESALLNHAAALLAEAPGDPTALRVLERLSARLPPDEARRALELRASSPTDRRARAARADLALRRGDAEAAHAIYSESRESSAMFAPSLIGLALRMGGASDLGDALAALEMETPRERAAVLAAAARALRAGGDRDRARALAEEAMRYDPRDLRGAIELAELVVEARSRGAETPGPLPAALSGAALERALAGVGARGRWSLALADIAEDAHESALAAAWSRRAWSLRPGDVEVARIWLGRAIALGDAELVAEVVRTTTGLLATVAPIARELGDAVRALAAHVDLEREIVRSLLALGGARFAPIREAALVVAREVPELALAVHERWLASGASAAERPVVLAAIASVARNGGDLPRVADACARLLAEPEASDAQKNDARSTLVGLATASLPADVEILVRQAIAEREAKDALAILEQSKRLRHTPAQEARLREVADTFRTLGRDLWDLAEDRDAALRAWLRGALLLGSEGLERIEVDIVHFGGEAAARDAVFELSRRADPTDLWAVGPASIALAESFQLRAWQRTLDRPPSYVEPVSLAREAAARSGDPAALLPAFEALSARLRRPDILNDLYDLTAGRAAGRYGERGVRYHAARVLDRLGRPEEALLQAVRAFSAVPAEGAILVMLERLGRSSHRADVAIAALVEAADQADDAEKRATWLDRAAQLASSEIADPSDRIDLLLRLFLTAPSARTCASVVEAMRAVIAADPGSRETWTQRLLRAHKKIEGKLGYIDRLPVLGEVARAVAEFEDVKKALDLVAKGSESTPRSDLDPLYPVAEEVAKRDPEQARTWLDGTTTGGSVRAHVAWGAGDPDRAIQLLVETAPEGDEIDFGDGDSGAKKDIALLELWAKSARDKRVIAAAWARFGRRGGASTDLEAARALDDAGDSEGAARALMSAWKERAEADASVIASVIELAREVFPQAGAWADLLEMLLDDLERHPPHDSADAIPRWREIAEIRAIHLGDRAGALDALVEAGRLVPLDEDLWNEISELAEAIGAHDRLAAALAQRLQRARPDRRVNLLRKLARVLEHDLGRDAEAAERWAELVRLLPLDAEAADALERIAERRGGRGELIDLLRARAARLPVGHAERTRALRRVARELEGTPGRRGEVLSALREVHQQSPSDTEVALKLAALARSAGDIGTAAEALLRAFRATVNPEGRVHLAIESSRVLLELHDHDTAARVLDEAATGAKLENDPRALDLLRLQLEVAIARGDARDEALTRIRIAELDTHAPPGKRAANCSSAARALMGMGERTRARELAWTACRAAPGDPTVAALLAELEFGGDTVRDPAKPLPQDAELLAILGKIDHTASGPPEMLSVIAFVRAELLDTAQGAGAGYRDLHHWPDEVRSQPLAQLALAERLAAEWSFGAAALAYERAFAGDLRGFRPTGATALRAADVAARSNDPARAKTFLDLAARDPACRIDARRRAVDLARALGDAAGAVRALQRLAAESSGAVRAQALAEQARLIRAEDPETALETMRLAVQAADEGSALRNELERELMESVRGGHGLPPGAPPELRDSGITSSRDAPTAPAPDVSPLAPPPAPPSGEGVTTSPHAVPDDITGPQSPAPSGRWLEPHATSEPPPEAPPRRSSQTPPTVERVEFGRSVDPRAEPEAEPMALSKRSSSQKMPEVRPPEPETSDLSDQPRLTVVGDAPGVPYRPRSIPSLPRPAGADAPALDFESLDRIASDKSAPIADRVRALKTLGEAAHEGGREEEAARHFISALELGDISAGDDAAELLTLLPGRSADLLLVRRRQAFLAPGDRSLLDGLHAAALETRDLVFARAIDHVRRAFDETAGPVPPPALDQQLDRPDLVLPLLERRAVPAAAESLRLTWEHAASIFKRDFNAYGITGVERVQPTVGSPLGRLVLAAERLLGMSRTPIHLRQRKGRDVESVLLVPPAVVLGGDCRDDAPDVRYLLGAGLIAAHPSHCLLLGQSEPSARTTWQALLSAFGPPEHGRGVSAEVGRLAASLWQSIPRAAQRRLGELLGNSPPSFEVAVEGARQVARRAGLYLSGDLAAAVRATLGEGGEVTTLAPGDLGTVCAANASIADLVRLATSPEFAEARWRTMAIQRRGTPSSGGFAPPSIR